MHGTLPHLLLISPLLPFLLCLTLITPIMLSRSAQCQTCLFAFRPSAESRNDCFALCISPFRMTALGFLRTTLFMLLFFKAVYGAGFVSSPELNGCVYKSHSFFPPGKWTVWERVYVVEHDCIYYGLFHQLYCLGGQIHIVGEAGMIGLLSPYNYFICLCLSKNLCEDYCGGFNNGDFSVSFISIFRKAFVNVISGLKEHSTFFYSFGNRLQWAQ